MRPRAEIFLLAASVFAFELAQTRVASFLLQYHYTFFAIAAGLGALGLGIALAARGGSATAPRRARASTVAGAILLGAHAAPAALPDLSLGELSAAVALSTSAAFTALGYALGLALEGASESPRRAYAADAAGAATGALAALAAMELGGPAAAVAFAVASTLAAGVLGTASRPARAALGLLLAGALPAALFSAPGAELAPAESPLGHRLRRGGAVLETRWDAYARTDLVAAPPDLGFEEVYADGTAPALIVRRAAEPSVAQAHRRELPYLPFVLRRPGGVLSLGGGGGYDAWLARLAGASEVDVAEINRAALSLAATRTGTSAGALQAPGVRVHVDDGRRFLRHAARRYDLVLLALYQGQAEARASVALLEASGYTREALAEYLAHLTPGGRVAVLLHDQPLAERLWRTAEAVLPPGGAVLGFEHPSSAPYRYLVYFGAAPWSAGEREVLAAIRREGRFHPFARTAPGHLDLTPTTDDHPFFFHTEASAPPGVWAIALVAGMAALALALWPGRGRAPALARATALLSGAGFAALELVLAQRFLPALGFPVLSLAAVSLGMLAGATSGALYGQRHPRGVAWACLGLAVLAALVGAGSGAARALAGAPRWAAAGAALGLAAVCGFLAGHALPAALERAGAARGCAPRLWALSSLGAVCACSAAVLVAMEWGWFAGAVLPAGCYAALSLSWGVGPRRP